MIDVRTQRFRITSTIFLLVTLIVGILSWSIISTARSGQEKRILAREEVFLDLIALTCHTAFHTNQFGEAQIFADRLTQNPYIEQVILADHRNRIVVGTSFERLGEELQKSRLPGETWKFRTIADETGKLGTLAVRFNRDELVTATKSMWKRALVLAPAGLLVIVGGSWLMGTLLSRRLERLAGAVREVAAGNLDIAIDDGGRDEISGVATAFNKMTSSLRQTLGELRRNEELLQAAVNVSRLGIFDHDHGADIVYRSPRLQEILGLDGGESPGIQSFFDIVHPDDLERCVALSQRAHDPSGNGILEMEHRIIRRDGSIRWIKGRAQSFFEGEGEARQAVRTVGAVMDITESRQAQEELLLSEQKYASIFHLMPDMVGITRMTDGRFLEVNDRFERWTGWKREEVIGRSSLDLGLWTPEARAQAVTIMKEQGHLENYEFILRTKSGELRNALMYLTPIRIMGEECFYFMARDVTERTQAEAEIRKLNETLEQRVRERTAQLESAVREQESFSYSVSHDLRAPLRHINSFSSILREEYGEQIPTEAHHYLNRIIRASGQMGHLIDDLLELSRVGRTEMRPESVDLGEMAKALVAMLRETAPERRVAWEIADALRARGDHHLLRQALQNLLENAWKYTSKNSDARIEFGKTDMDGEEVFFIRDNGAGFDMNYVKKLFVPFQRLHTEREFEGTGIGLATVKRIIERHGGRIWAEGKEDEGATFYFTLPQA